MARQLKAGIRRRTKGHCIWCGKPLVEKVDQVWFGSRLTSITHYTRVEFPLTVAEAAALAGVELDRVTKFTWGESTRDRGPEPVGTRYVDTIWFGTDRYGVHDEELFCTKECGYRMGRAAARQGYRRKVTTTEEKT